MLLNNLQFTIYLYYVLARVNGRLWVLLSQRSFSDHAQTTTKIDAQTIFQIEPRYVQFQKGSSGGRSHTA